MVIRVIGVAFVGLALLLAGCGAFTAPAPSVPPVSDEDQIRHVIARVSEAHGVDKLENIVVNADTATADAALVISTTLVREDGRWKDCTPLDE